MIVLCEQDMMTINVGWKCMLIADVCRWIEPFVNWNEYVMGVDKNAHSPLACNLSI